MITGNRLQVIIAFLKWMEHYWFYFIAPIQSQDNNHSGNNVLTSYFCHWRLYLHDNHHERRRKAWWDSIRVSICNYISSKLITDFSNMTSEHQTHQSVLKIWSESGKADRPANDFSNGLWSSPTPLFFRFSTFVTLMRAVRLWRENTCSHCNATRVISPRNE